MSIFDEMSPLDDDVKITIEQPKPKIALFTHVVTFIDDIMHDLKQKGHEVRLINLAKSKEHDIVQAVKWADVCWFDFCHEIALRLINQNLGKLNKKVVMRWHRFEIMEQPFPLLVNWNFVDDLILVSSEMKKMLLEMVPELEQRTRVHYIPNGVNTSKFTPSQNLNMKKIAFVAKALIRKNHSLALQVIYELTKLDPEYELHFVGAKDPRLFTPYINKMVKKMGIEKNVIIHDWIDDMDSFYQDKGIILSTSLHESFGYAIAEAMAMGAYPVVHDYVGAEEFWPEEILFCSIEEAVNKITNARPHQWVDYVQRFDLQTQCDDMAAILGNTDIAPKKKHAHASSSVQKVNRSGFSSGDYWEQRYQHGGNSGVGSYNELAEYKAEIINGFVKEKNIVSVAELGSGDGNQLKYYEFSEYDGFDVAETVVKRCRTLFKDMPHYHFHWLFDPELSIENHSNKYDLTMSIDVIYHLVEDEIYHAHLDTLFNMSKSYVIVYASDEDRENHNNAVHVRHRNFTKYIAQNMPEWRLLKKVDNPLKSVEKSPSDFFIFEKK